MKEFGLKPDPWWRKNSTLRKKTKKKQFTFWPYQPPEQIATILHLMSSTCKLHYWANKHKYYQSSAHMNKQCGFNMFPWFQQQTNCTTKIFVACWQCWVAGFVKLRQRYFGLFAYLPQTPATLRWTAVSTKQHKHMYPPILNNYNIYMYVHLLLCAFSITLDALPFPWNQQNFLPSVSEESGWNKWNVTWGNELSSALPHWNCCYQMMQSTRSSISEFQELWYLHWLF